MKRCLNWVIGITFLVACVAIVWYHIPTKMQKNAMACSMDGEVIEVEFDLVRQRHLFGDEDLEGSITIGGVRYDNCDGPVFAPYGFTAIENSVTVFYYDENLDVFWLHLSNEEKNETYYGEATNPEEVQEVIRKRMEGMEK